MQLKIKGITNDVTGKWIITVFAYDSYNFDVERKIKSFSDFANNLGFQLQNKRIMNTYDLYVQYTFTYN